jgi:type II secretory pathway pseudopilin PulG
MTIRARTGNGRRGFSLITVLIIAIIGVAIVGVTMQLMTSSSGAGRVASAAVTKYNILQAAVEEAKAVLKENMDNTNPPPRYFKTSPTPITASTDITSSDMLLIETDLIAQGPGIAVKRTLTRTDLGQLGIAGNNGDLSVAIYDMQYEPARVRVDLMSSADVARLPPSINLKGDADWDPSVRVKVAEEKAAGLLGGNATNMGVYLIRARLVLNGSEDTLDSSLMQSNNL